MMVGCQVSILIGTSILISKVGERGDHSLAPSYCGSRVSIIQDLLRLVTTNYLSNTLQDQSGAPQVCVLIGM